VCDTTSGIKFLIEHSLLGLEQTEILPQLTLDRPLIKTVPGRNFVVAFNEVNFAFVYTYSRET